MDRRANRITYPTNTENRGPVSKKPNVPVVEKVVVNRLACVTKGERLGAGEVFTTKYTRDGRPVRAAAPEAILPLTSPFQVEHGGGRHYGGGTSREALRRAKDKAKRRAASLY